MTPFLIIVHYVNSILTSWHSLIQTTTFLVYLWLTDGQTDIPTDWQKDINTMAIYPVDLTSYMYMLKISMYSMVHVFTHIDSGSTVHISISSFHKYFAYNSYTVKSFPCRTSCVTYDQYIHYLAPEGVAMYCFHPVCLCVCLCVCMYLCVRQIFWYFISRLLEEISIWNLYRILIWLYSIH